MPSRSSDGARRLVEFDSLRGYPVEVEAFEPALARMRLGERRALFDPDPDDTEQLLDAWFAGLRRRVPYPQWYAQLHGLVDHWEAEGCRLPNDYVRKLERWIRECQEIAAQRAGWLLQSDRGTGAVLDEARKLSTVAANILRPASAAAGRTAKASMRAYHPSAWQKMKGWLSDVWYRDYVDEEGAGTNLLDGPLTNAARFVTHDLIKPIGNLLVGIAQSVRSFAEFTADNTPHGVDITIGAAEEKTERNAQRVQSVADSLQDANNLLSHWDQLPIHQNRRIVTEVVAGEAITVGIGEAITAGISILTTRILRAPSVSGPSSTGPRLVHMTEAGDAILSSGRLGLPGDLYAGPASNAELSGWALTRRTGLSPSGNFEPIFIPEAAEAAFRKPVPIGITTTWQRLTGQQYAPRGVIDLGTGAFTRAGVNRTQALWYSFDVGGNAVIGGTAAAYWYSTSGDGR